MSKKFQGWVASLSNGETAFEGRGYSWEELVVHCKQEDLQITRLRLQCSGITVIAKPNADGYFESKHVRLKDNGTAVLQRGIGFIIGGDAFITFIDESRNVFMETADILKMVVNDPSKIYIR